MEAYIVMGGLLVMALTVLAYVEFSDKKQVVAH